MLATINFISALPVPCPTGQISEKDRCVPVPTEKRDFLDRLPDLHGETEIRKIRGVIHRELCPEGYIMIRGKCQPMKPKPK